MNVEAHKSTRVLVDAVEIAETLLQAGEGEIVKIFDLTHTVPTLGLHEGNCNEKLKMKNEKRKMEEPPVTLTLFPKRSSAR